MDVSNVVPILCELLHCNDQEILSHTSWAFSHLCDGTPSYIRAVTSSGWTAAQIKEEEMGKKKGGGICKVNIVFFTDFEDAIFCICGH